MDKKTSFYSMFRSAFRPRSLWPDSSTKSVQTKPVYIFTAHLTLRRSLTWWGFYLELTAPLDYREACRGQLLDSLEMRKRIVGFRP